MNVAGKAQYGRAGVCCHASEPGVSTYLRLPSRRHCNLPFWIASAHVSHSGRRCLRHVLLPRRHQARRAITTTTSAASNVDVVLDEHASQPSAEYTSRILLEWPAVCRQVSCFCETVMGAERVGSGQLVIGASLRESELLLQQTAEAMEAGLEFNGIYDIKPAVYAASQENTVLNARQLEAIGATLRIALKQREVAGSCQEGSEKLRFPALKDLAAGIDLGEQKTSQLLQTCFQYGDVTDAASDALAEVRRERRQNLDELKRTIQTWAQTLKARNACEDAVYTVVRDRYCIGVKSGWQSELPKGSVRLGSSGSGATIYMEPAPVVQLNNNETMLAQKQKTEETTIMAIMTKLIAERSEPLLSLMESVTALDVAAARAAYARWLGAHRPLFLSLDHTSLRSFGSNGEHAGGSLLWLPGARHPVLMQPALPRPPMPPSLQDNRFDRDFMEAPAWEKLLGASGTAGLATSSRTPAAPQLPKPLHLCVPADTKVVAITGPNTGGKTVTIKTAGLLTLMAKAGLYLPVDAAAVQEHGQPVLYWFDKVLADLGDSQSLQQSLSTFSGHVRRIQQILEVVTEQSLVLLDEVGSGTDPAEGAALARAILDRLASMSALSLATTHHAELKAAAQEDSRYVNVSMEFDISILAPTYKLNWGSAGSSNALDTAQRLAFDSTVVADARAIVQDLRRAQEVESQEALVKSVMLQLEEVRSMGVAARQRRLRSEKQLQETNAVLKKNKDRLATTKEWKSRLAQRHAELAAQLESVVQKYSNGQMELQEAEIIFRKRSLEIMRSLS